MKRAKLPLQPRVHLRPGERVRGLVGAGRVFTTLVWRDLLVQ